MTLNSLASCAHALGHVRRLQIIERLAITAATSAELCEAMGDIPFTSMRYHLQELINTGFVVCRHSGEQNMYTLVPARLGALCGQLDELFGGQ